MKKLEQTKRINRLVSRFACPIIVVGCLSCCTLSHQTKSQSSQFFEEEVVGYERMSICNGCKSDLDSVINNFKARAKASDSLFEIGAIASNHSINLMTWLDGVGLWVDIGPRMTDDLFQKVVKAYAKIEKNRVNDLRDFQRSGRASSSFHGVVLGPPNSYAGGQMLETLRPFSAYETLKVDDFDFFKAANGREFAALEKTKIHTKQRCFVLWKITESGERNYQARIADVCVRLKSGTVVSLSDRLDRF